MKLSTSVNQRIAKYLADHGRKSWDRKKLDFSYFIMQKPVYWHNLKELENDLIGNYFEKYHKTPEFQFKNIR